MFGQQEELSVLRRESQALRDRQVESSRQQAELQTEVQQLREELGSSSHWGQLECGALQAGLDKERQARENAESQLQSATDTLQDEKSSLQQLVQNLQAQLDQTRNQLDHTKTQLHHTRNQFKATKTQLNQSRTQLDQTRTSMLDPQKVQNRLEQLTEALTTGQDSYSPAGPEDLLSSSLERLYREVQGSRTSREQVQQAHNQSQEQIARLQAQLAQNQDQVAQLQAQLTQEKDQVAQLQAQLAQDRDQDQEEQWRLREELERLRDKLQSSQTQYRQIRHSLEAELEQSQLQLQDVQEERDALLAQLRSESAAHQKTLGRLDRKLRQLSRFMSDSDQLTAEQLRSAAEQLSALHSTVELIDREREQDGLDERDGSVLQAGLERVKRSLEREREHTHTLQDQHTHTVEELRAELTAAQQHTHTLRQQLDRARARTRTGRTGTGRTGTGTRDGGQWYYIPPGHSAPSLGSLGTQDSGLGLQYLSSPDRGRQRDRPPTGGGYWVYIPQHTPALRQSGGTVEEVVMLTAVAPEEGLLSRLLAQLRASLLGSLTARLPCLERPGSSVVLLQLQSAALRCTATSRNTHT
ncbi:uncharacterized protein LOC139917837 [Centroberyx gerrardi]